MSKLTKILFTSLFLFVFTIGYSTTSNAESVKQYIEYIADRRLERIRLEKLYDVHNPFPWMSEVMDLRKEKNFFETRVTEYQTGGVLQWG